VLLRANAAKVVVTDVAAAPDQVAGEFSAALEPGIYDIFVSAPCVVPFVAQLKVGQGEVEMLPVQLKSQFDADLNYRSGCPGPDDFSLPLIDTALPPLPDHIPLISSSDTINQRVQ
jgi:hypothetical protein